MGRKGRAVSRGLIAGGAATLLVAALASTSLWHGFEERAQGLILARRGPLPWCPEVAVVDLDEETLRKMQPMGRTEIARVLEAIGNAGARVVAFDILFRATAAKDGEIGDARLAAAASGFGRTVFMMECSHGARPASPEELEVIDSSALDPGAVASLRCGAIGVPFGPIHDSGRLAHAMIAASDSGNARSLYAFAQAGPSKVPVLGLATYQVGKGLPASAIAMDDGMLRVGDRRLALDRRGRVTVSHRGLPREGVVSFGEIFDAVGFEGPAVLPEPLAARLRGRFVVVGYTALSQADIGPAITGERIPMVALHAALLSDLIEGRTVRELGGAASLLLVLLSGLLLTLAGALLSARNAILSLAAFLIVTANLGIALAGRDLLVAPLGPMAAATFALAGALAARLSVNDRERQLLMSAFGSYVHPAVLKRILEDPESTLQLGGARKTVSVLFSDIAGYTSHSNRAPEEVLGELREYMAAMTGIVVRHEGRVDKIMGDGLLAVFGDPISRPDHPRQAVEASLEMQEAVAALSERWRAQGREGISIRIGIATGEVFVGNIGASGAKIEYTVLGPTVNLASRLEGKAPEGGVLVSRETREACGPDFPMESVPGLRLKGFESDYEAFRVLGAARAA